MIPPDLALVPEQASRTADPKAGLRQLTTKIDAVAALFLSPEEYARYQACAPGNARLDWSVTERA